MSLYGCAALWVEPLASGLDNENEIVYALSFTGEEIVAL